ncbi:MAG: outer membrane chaperone Skp [Bacteroidetes bacterium HGW-Bacteroidetes-2]|jgi:outer membrane protein|nr:MAG: outer membrane chaperone Skp [Bacteroidetes bacterium HGW-Bacteroidetes-2]
MKKIFFLISLVVISMTGFSQSKVGTVDVDYILSKMPELKQVSEAMTEYGTGLDKQFKEKMTAYQAILDGYNNSTETFTDAQVKERQGELYALEQEITKFQQNAVQLIRIKEDELKRPLYQNIAQSLEKIAKAENYTQVLSLTDNNTVIYIDPNFDLTLSILKDLGISIE